MFNGIESIEAFLQRAVTQDIEASQAALEKSRLDYAELLKQKRRTSEIKARSNLTLMVLDKSLIDSAETINSVLAAKLENRHEAAKAELNNHIKRCFTKVDGAEQWIQQGLGYVGGDNCGFCGQSITPEVNELLDIYRQCFDDQYARHEGFVSSSLQRSRPQLTLNLIPELVSHIQQTDLIIQAYPELSEEPDAKTVMDAIKAGHQEIYRLLERLQVAGDTSIERFNEVIPLKLAGPDKEVAPVVLDDLRAVFDTLARRISALNLEIAVFKQHIETFKARLEDNQIEQQLTVLKDKGVALGQDVQRFEKNDACMEYQQLITDIDSLRQEIPG
ncbi:hypothetical protein [Aliamphritea spongicola]|nr:hypothetical protein [Aliamphritea spongicola]